MAFARFVAICAWVYLAVAVAIAALIRFAGDRFWPATVLLFGPRWIWLAPVVLLGVAVFLVRDSLPIVSRWPHALWPVAAAGLLVLFLVMGLNVPIRRVVSGTPPGDAVWIMTVNAASKAANVTRLRQVVDAIQPDVVVVEECDEGAFSSAWTAGSVFTERSLCLATKYRIRESELLGGAELGGRGAAARFDLELPRGVLHLFLVHLSTPREGLEELRHRGWRAGPRIDELSEIREREADAVRAWMRRTGTPGPSIVAGDFNTPEESRIFADAWTGLANAFSDAGWGFGYTKRTRLIGARIDHVLTTDELAAAACRVGPDIGSDHLPVIADLRWR